MLRRLIVVIAMLSPPARASAGEVIVCEGGYRFTCPDDWEVRKRGDSDRRTQTLSREPAADRQR